MGKVKNITVLMTLVLAFGMSSGFATAADSLAENTENSPCAQVVDRPCVALVLGGGGARGGAHIGVLKALEELQTPLDLIVGTSIGAFVGGLYASGNRVKDIEQLFQQADWNSGYQDALSRDKIPNRRKRQLDNIPIHLDLGLGLNGVKIPKGFLQGQGLKQLIDSMVGLHPTYTSFDELPIPFRAVAADIETGQEVVIDAGDLATALQISMSLPGILRPVERDQKFLVDGGIANNLPVSVAQALGADIVIAVNIEAPAVTRDELGSSLAILRQLTSLLTHSNVEYQKSLLDANDIYIAPDTSSLSLLGFDRVLDGIEPGYLAAMAQLEQNSTLLALATDTPSAESQVAESRQRFEIGDIHLTNYSRLSDEYLLRRMNFHIGESYSLSDIQSGIDRLYGSGTISRIHTSVEEVEGSERLGITVEEKEWGPGYLDLLLTFEDDFKSFSRYQFGGSYRLTNLSPYGAEWYTVANFGTEKHLYSELHWPIKTTGFFWQISGERSRQVFELFIDDNSLGTGNAEQDLFFAGVGWGSTDHFDAVIGPVLSESTSEIPALLAAAAGLDEINVKQSGWQLQVNYDSLDHPNFPSRGWKLEGNYLQTDDEYLGVSSASDQTELEINGVFSLGRHSFRNLVRYQSTTTDNPASLVGSYPLGGFLNLSGNAKNSLFGRQVRYFSVVYTYKLIANDFGAITLPLYLGLSAERGNVWDRASDVNYGDLIDSGSVFIGWDSPLGPAYLAYGQSETGQESVYFFLGVVF